MAKIRSFFWDWSGFGHFLHIIYINVQFTITPLIAGRFRDHKNVTWLFEFVTATLQQLQQCNVQKEQREQSMTSLEIAELTGKQHKDVLKAIRKMEPAWENIAGSNFRLGSYKERERRLKFQLTRAQFSALGDRRQTNITVVIAEESDHSARLCRFLALRRCSGATRTSCEESPDHDQQALTTPPILQSLIANFWCFVAALTFVDPAGARQSASLKDRQSLVAVLQLLQFSRLTSFIWAAKPKPKMPSKNLKPFLYLYIYLYIYKYRVNSWHYHSLFSNCNNCNTATTATRQSVLINPITPQFVPKREQKRL